MRENIGYFRGKCNYDGDRDNEWIYGSFLREGKDNLPIIVEDNSVESDDRVDIRAWATVHPETVGEYTGLTDKKGVMIFEGDIVRGIYDSYEFVYVVVWDNDDLGFLATNGKEKYGASFQYLSCCEEIEVIGNIHDNPELLGGDDNAAD